MADKRDPLKDPLPYDVVDLVYKDGYPFKLYSWTVEAVIGNLVAYTVDQSAEVIWVLRRQWCDPNTFIDHWEVQHRGDE